MAVLPISFGLQRHRHTLLNTLPGLLDGHAAYFIRAVLSLREGEIVITFEE